MLSLDLRSSPRFLFRPQLLTLLTQRVARSAWTRLLRPSTSASWGRAEAATSPLARGKERVAVDLIACVQRMWLALLVARWGRITNHREAQRNGVHHEQCLASDLDIDGYALDRVIDWEVNRSLAVTRHGSRMRGSADVLAAHGAPVSGG